MKAVAPPQTHPFAVGPAFGRGSDDGAHEMLGLFELSGLVLSGDAIIARGGRRIAGGTTARHPLPQRQLATCDSADKDDDGDGASDEPPEVNELLSNLSAAAVVSFAIRTICLPLF